MFSENMKEAREAVDSAIKYLMEAQEELLKCDMIKVHPDFDGFGVESPCKNKAEFSLMEDWKVCSSCLEGLLEEDIEEAHKAVPIEAP